MKIVFLDIDGVLNSQDWWKSLPEDVRRRKQANDDHFDPMAVDRVNRLLKESQAKVVISSAWRALFDFEDLKAILTRNNLKADIIGKTKYKMSSGRYNEISWWLEENDVESMVILEDDWDMHHLEPWTVRTTWLEGIKEDHVVRALEILNTPWPGLEAVLKADGEKVLEGWLRET